MSFYPCGCEDLGEYIAVNPGCTTHVDILRREVAAKDAEIARLRAHVIDLTASGYDLLACLDEMTEECEGPHQIFDHAQSKMRVWHEVARIGAP